MEAGSLLFLYTELFWCVKKGYKKIKQKLVTLWMAVYIKLNLVLVGKQS